MTEEVRFEARQFALQGAIPDHINLESRREPEFRAWAHTLTTNVWSRKRGYYSHPDGWWNAFKARWFREWMRERWPIQMKEVIAWEMFPDYHPALDPKRFGHSVMVFDPDELKYSND